MLGGYSWDTSSITRKPICMPCRRSSGADAAARGIFAGSGTDSIAIGVHVGGDRQTIDHSIFVPEMFDHAIAPEFPPAINGITRRSVPDTTLAIDAVSRSFGELLAQSVDSLRRSHTSGVGGEADMSTSLKRRD
jgi:hypothetical protein